MTLFMEPEFVTQECGDTAPKQSEPAEKVIKKHKATSLKFHSAHDAGFSAYALPSTGKPGSSGAWINSRCHCVDCEILSNKEYIKKCNAIVLLDLDNISTLSNRLRPRDYISNGTFLWGFANFVHEAFRHEIPCTPCGKEDQAVDLVILMCIDKIARKFPRKRLLVVTMDKALQKSSALRGASTLALSDHTPESWIRLHDKLVSIGDFFCPSLKPRPE
ncbi:hypothetical protein XU18_0473 [Perkinsela sp. CCAP 1560/4]|nr:hypothetical protein XU18_0473 [Perkinsela sp. CCAP 1560/4]|eukprot:KNH09788.1 hypothetical protein XU18_0473 [Perkinsela sp. CCAP 1560/4]